MSRKRHQADEETFAPDPEDRSSQPFDVAPELEAPAAPPAPEPAPAPPPPPPAEPADPDPDRPPPPRQTPRGPGAPESSPGTRRGGRPAASRVGLVFGVRSRTGSARR